MGALGMAEKLLRLLRGADTVLLHHHRCGLRAFEGEMRAADIREIVQQHQHNLLRQAQLLHPFIGHGDIALAQFAPAVQLLADGFGKHNIALISGNLILPGDKALSQMMEDKGGGLVADALHQPATLPIAQRRVHLAFLHAKGSRHFRNAKVFLAKLAAVQAI